MVQVLTDRMGSSKQLAEVRLTWSDRGGRLLFLLQLGFSPQTRKAPKTFGPGLHLLQDLRGGGATNNMDDLRLSCLGLDILTVGS